MISLIGDKPEHTAFVNIIVSSMRETVKHTSVEVTWCDYYNLPLQKIVLLSSFNETWFNPNLNTLKVFYSYRLMLVCFKGISCYRTAFGYRGSR